MRPISGVEQLSSRALPVRNFQCLEETLLTTSPEAGKTSDDLLKQLDRFFRVPSDPVKAARDAKVDFSLNHFESYVHMDRNLLDLLDELYVNHFRADEQGALRIHHCFNLYEDPEKCNKFKAYLTAVLDVLQKVMEGESFQTYYQEGDPNAVGIDAAWDRIEPLFYPLMGRINLPLPCVSMLEDLKTCVLVDGGVISQVRTSVCFQLGPSLTN